jgi:DNA-binding NtrC family response regulator
MEDIPLLAEFFLKKYTAANASKVIGFTKTALAKLMRMRWEGNVRELENVIERTVVLTSKDWIDDKDLPGPELASPEQFFNAATKDFPTIAQLEKKYIQLVLDKTGGQKEKAAHILGINRRTLYRKEREYGWVTHPINDEEGLKAWEGEEEM